MSIIKNDVNGHFLKVSILDGELINNPPSTRKLKAFSGLRIVTNAQGKSHYESQKRTGDYNNAVAFFKSSINRNLLSPDHSGKSLSNWVSLTPINGRAHVFNEELCIMLAYFHLSNVVRYNPEHLYKLMDSKYWALILGLRKHGYLRFLKLMYGNYIKECVAIN